eukprot:CAMPEP_0117603670 /NCGR_PEP_ID=MMETSP0784-20121206/78277_1 /TAXON_ID=39447 /ORGANISM="" /LENGTH=109 /DNA_ID=CAMNT_0005406649 /DNA_START=188 /DNA_END=518 /DNA_ORIENTATION=+
MTARIVHWATHDDDGQVLGAIAHGWDVASAQDDANDRGGLCSDDRLPGMPRCNVPREIHPLLVWGVPQQVEVRLIFYEMRLVLCCDPSNMVSLKRSELVQGQQLMHLHQ